MSISLMNEAWKSDLPSARKLVLLSLCDNANDQGECYPSISTISKRCGMSERSVFRCIDDFEKTGAIRRENRVGRSTVYHIDSSRFCTPATVSPTPATVSPTPATVSPTPATVSPPVPDTVSPITTIEPSSNQIPNTATVKNHGAIAVAIFDVGDVDKNVWADFVKLRKAKKAPLTKTAVDGIRKEALKAGLTLEAGLRICCQRGWAGFNAGWLASPQSGETAGRSGETAYQRSMRLKYEEATGRHTQPLDARTVIDITPASNATHGALQ